jgi:uncharacterized protein YeaO (DUF488 family)
MKTLFTSCYGRSKWFPKGATQVRISCGIPWWWKPTAFDAIALAPEPPTWAAYKAGKDWTAPYREQLKRLQTTGDLAALVESLPDGAILLCHEADWTECHRKVLADYLNEKGLAAVTEFERAPRQSALQVLLSFVT